MMHAYHSASVPAFQSNHNRESLDLCFVNMLTKWKDYDLIFKSNAFCKNGIICLTTELK